MSAGRAAGEGCADDALPGESTGLLTPGLINQAALHSETIPPWLSNASQEDAAELGRRTLGQKEDDGPGAWSRQETPQAGSSLVPHRLPRWAAAASHGRAELRPENEGGKLKQPSPQP